MKPSCAGPLLCIGAGPNGLADFARALRALCGAQEADNMVYLGDDVAERPLFARDVARGVLGGEFSGGC